MTKLLVLMRHGKAQAPAESGVSSDFEKILSEKGRKDSLTSALKLIENGFVKPDLIISSPLVRAVQTAEIVSEAFKKKEIKIETALSGSSDLQAILNCLFNHFSNCDSLIAIGHQPTMGMTVEYLTGQLINLGCAGFAYMKLDPCDWKDKKKNFAHIIKAFNP